MTSDTHHDFVARSRPRMWVMIVLPLAAALLIYVGWESLGADFSVRGRGAFLNDMPAWFRGTFFFGSAAVCLGAWVQQLWRKLSPQVEVEADPQGITSHLFWGKGQLRWPDIVALERKGNWLFVRGTGPNAKPKKLVIDTASIDAPIDDLFAIIAQHRPDLLARA
jgi:hypothetical protein